MAKDLKSLEDNYNLKIEFIEKLKYNIRIKIFLLKFLLTLFIIILIYEPTYNILLELLIFINQLYNTRYQFLITNYEIIFYSIFSIPIIILLLFGFFPFRKIFFVSGFLILIFGEIDMYWVIKYICLFFLYKIPEIMQKFQNSYKNYSSYKESYIELLSLKNVFDTVLKQYLTLLTILILSSYTLIFLFEILSINIGAKISIFLPLILLPILTVLLYFSPNVSTSLKKLILKKDNINS
jgi:hypothetical protein